MAAAAAPVTAVKWLWLDNDTWRPYAADVGLKLETAFARGVKEIKVDDQRFVQIIGLAELRKNFLKLPNDTSACVGMQRRYDDESKRRVVKREVPQFFSDSTFHFAGKWADAVKDDLTEDINMYGGLVSGALTKKVTVVLCGKDDAEGYDRAKGKAREWDIPVVSDDYVAACIAAAKLVATGPHVVKPAPAAAPAAAAAAPAKKRSRRGAAASDSSDEEGAEEKKKGRKGKKRGRDESSSDEGESSDDGGRRKKKKKADAEAAPAIDFVVGSQLMGLYSCGANEHYPMVVTVSAVVKDAAVVAPAAAAAAAAAAPAAQAQAQEGCKLEGKIQWPTLNGAETKFRGTVSAAGAVVLDEYEVVKGQDDVEVPNKYVGRITGTAVLGEVEGNAGATFRLDHIPGPAPVLAPADPAPAAAAPAAAAAPPPPPPLPKEFEALRAGANLKATVTLRLECTLAVESAPAGVGGEAVAVATWALGGAKSRLRGTVAADGTLELTETEVDKAAPLRAFRGQLQAADKAVRGPVQQKDAPADPALGTFELSLQ
eukprot:m51a1_g6851 hypothetical protein (543) ;mRNA; r:98277-100002